MQTPFRILILTSCCAAIAGCATSRTGGYNDGYDNDRYSNLPKTEAYIACERGDNNDQILGAVIGGVIGGVAGREIAGRNSRTEGTVVGAGVGAAAGARIADKNCDRFNGPEYRENGRYYYDSTAYPRSGAGYTVNGVTYYDKNDVRRGIDHLEDEDRRLADDYRRTNSRSERDRINDRRNEINVQTNELERLERRIQN